MPKPKIEICVEFLFYWEAFTYQILKNLIKWFGFLQFSSIFYQKRPKGQKEAGKSQNRKSAFEAPISGFSLQD